MPKDDAKTNIYNFFSKLSRARLPTEEKIKILDAFTREVDELKSEAEKYERIHGISYAEALKEILKRKYWQKNNLKPNAVKAPE